MGGGMGMGGGSMGGNSGGMGDNFASDSMVNIVFFLLFNFCAAIFTWYFSFFEAIVPTQFHLQYDHALALIILECSFIYKCTTFFITVTLCQNGNYPLQIFRW